MPLTCACPLDVFANRVLDGLVVQKPLIGSVLISENLRARLNIAAM